MTGLEIALGYLFDFLLGGIPIFAGVVPHPVAVIGGFVTAQENFYRKNFSNLLAAGVVLALVTTGSVFVLSFLLVTLAFNISFVAGFAVNAALIYFSISPEQLAREGEEICRLLRSDDLEGARKRLSMIVGRDTNEMTREEIIRACVETLAENSVDAAISPLFFAAVGGGPLAMAYRSVNTLDSMTGYRNEKYEMFGKASARLDDAANFLPARLSIPIIFLASLFLGFDAKGSLRTALRDRLKHPSPNSAHPESAFAGALGVLLGGASRYDGVLKEKPLLGDGSRAYDYVVAADAARLLRATSLVALAVFAVPHIVILAVALSGK